MMTARDIFTADSARAMRDIIAMMVADPECEELENSRLATSSKQDIGKLTKVTKKKRMFMMANAKLALSIEHVLFKWIAHGLCVCAPT